MGATESRTFLVGAAVVVGATAASVVGFTDDVFLWDALVLFREYSGSVTISVSKPLDTRRLLLRRISGCSGAVSTALLASDVVGGIFCSCWLSGWTNWLLKALRLHWSIAVRHSSGRNMHGVSFTERERRKGNMQWLSGNDNVDADWRLGLSLSVKHPA